MHVCAIANFLRAIGIRPLAARSRAWLRMVREAPPSALANALGISAATAMRYAEGAGTDYLAYASISKRWTVDCLTWKPRRSYSRFAAARSGREVRSTVRAPASRASRRASWVRRPATP
jgi:hypothetical protein